MEYQGRNVCPKCHRAYVKWINVCPKCKIFIRDNKIDSRNSVFLEYDYPYVIEYEINRVGKIVDKKTEQLEGEGRKYGAGGDACNICPHCNGSKNYCPVLD